MNFFYKNFGVVGAIFGNEYGFGVVEITLEVVFALGFDEIGFGVVETVFWVVMCLGVVKIGFEVFSFDFGVVDIDLWVVGVELSFSVVKKVFLVVISGLWIVDNNFGVVFDFGFVTSGF